MQNAPSVTPVLHDLLGSNRVSKMRTTIALCCVLLLAVSNNALAQTRYGTVLLNNYDSGKGLYFVCPTAAYAGTMVEVLGGPEGSSLSPIYSTSLGNPARYMIREEDRNALGPG